MHPCVGALRVHSLLVLFRVLALVALISTPAFSLARDCEERRDEVESEREHESEEWEARGLDHEDGRSDEDDFDSSLPVPDLAAEVVRAGERVVVHWNPVGTRVEEFELILSFDGGRTWTLRISPELHPGKDRYEWDVPNLAADQARIRIRARIDEREVWGPEGAPFRMVSSSNRPKEQWLFWETLRWDQGTVEGATQPLITAEAPSLRAGTDSAPIETPVRLLVPPRPLTGRTLGRGGFRLACVVAPSSGTFRERRRLMRE